MRVLVTGAAGRLGSAVLKALENHEVRTLVGDARDPAAVREALKDADAVIHTAALASPEVAAPEVVFAANTQATFVVLNEAGEAGVRRAVIASSLSITGLPFARSRPKLPYLPLDADTPLQAEDPYALSKQVDEATAAMMHRRHGMTVAALRFPFLGDPARLAARAAMLADNPAAGAADLWSYLDLRDAARACVLALTAPLHGAPVIFVAAPQTLMDTPTEELLAEHHPDVPCRTTLPGRTVAIDLEPARRLLGFTAEEPRS